MTRASMTIRAFMPRYECEYCERVWIGDGKKTLQDYCNHVDVCEKKNPPKSGEAVK